MIVLRTALISDAAFEGGLFLAFGLLGTLVCLLAGQ